MENAFIVSFFDAQGNLKLDILVEETSDKLEKWLLKKNYTLGATFLADSRIWQLASWSDNETGQGVVAAIIKDKYAYRLAWHENNFDTLKNLVRSFELTP